MAGPCDNNNPVITHSDQWCSLPLSLAHTVTQWQSPTDIGLSRRSSQKGRQEMQLKSDLSEADNKPESNDFWCIAVWVLGNIACTYRLSYLSMSTGGSAAFDWFIKIMTHNDIILSKSHHQVYYCHSHCQWSNEHVVCPKKGYCSCSPQPRPAAFGTASVLSCLSRSSIWFSPGWLRCPRRPVSLKVPGLAAPIWHRRGHRWVCVLIGSYKQRRPSRVRAFRRRVQTS